MKHTKKYSVVKCNTCGASFKKETGQLNRSIRRKSNVFCSTQCHSISKIKNLKGLRFGRLLVIEMVLSGTKLLYPKNRAVWKCLCDCGNERIVLGNYLVKGYSKSCGCHTKERSYGQTKNPEYKIWRNMQKRCYDTKNEKYKDYGGRGIKVCERWLISFKNFLFDMGKRPSVKHTIDRINNDGNYEIENCRWATTKQQARNKRNNRWIDYNGERKILQDWAEFFNVSQSALSNNILRHKDFKDVYNYYVFEKQKRLIEYKGHKKTVSDWAVFFKIKRSTLAERIEKGQDMDYIYNFYLNKNGLFNNQK